MPSNSPRRRFLATAGALLTGGVAGCVSAPTGTTLTVDGDPVPTDTANVSVAVGRQPDAERPGVVRIAFTNTAESRRKFTFSASPPFSGLSSKPRSDGGFALLVPLQSTVHVAASVEGLPPARTVVPAEPRNGCWRARAGLDVEPVAVTRTLGPGETLAERYAVLAGPMRPESCPLRGTYRFESNSYFETAWGFALTVSGTD